MAASPIPERRPAPRARAEMDDAELVRRAQLGSAAAFEELVVRIGPATYGYLALRLRHDADARDALQETLTAAWQALPSLREPARFRAWVLGIAAHKAADVTRNRLPVGEARLERQGREDESLLDLREAILSLSPHLRDVLLLRYVLHVPEEEVADALGLRVGTVKSRSSRARAALSERLR